MGKLLSYSRKSKICNVNSVLLRKNIFIMDRKDNSLNMFRMIAAFQVMYGHVNGHLHTDMPMWTNSLFSIMQGVPIFFTLSGFLIWFSIENSTSYGAYLKKRFLRIYPELWGSVVVSTIAILILWVGWNVKDIFIYIITSGSIFQFWTPYSIRGYGSGAPNGSLWTICSLIQFYIIAWALHLLLKKANAICNVLFFALLVALSEFIPYLNNKYLHFSLLEKLYGHIVIRYLWIFVFGMILAKYFDEIIEVVKKYWLVFFVIAALSRLTGFDVMIGGYYLVHTCSISCSIVGFAYKYTGIKVKDISYAIYLYHMIVVNIMIMLGYTEKKIYLLITMIISTIVAYLSTIFIGERIKRGA